MSGPAPNPPSAPTVNLLEAWFTPVRFVLVLGALIVVAFPDVLLGVKSFYYRDFGLFGYPLAFYHRASFWRGELPLWNPLNNCGVPFLAHLLEGIAKVDGGVPLNLRETEQVRQLFRMGMRLTVFTAVGMIGWQVFLRFTGRVHQNGI